MGESQNIIYFNLVLLSYGATCILFEVLVVN